MSIDPKVEIKVNLRLQPFFDTELNHNSEFQDEIERFKWLLKDNKRDLNGLKVGKIASHRFNNGDIISYSLVSETIDNGIKNYVVEIQNFVSKEAYKALNQNQEWLKRYWHILCHGVARADSIHFWIEITLAIGILSTLFTSKILSKDVPEINNRPVVEHQAPKLPVNK